MNETKLQQLSEEWATQYNRIKKEEDIIREADLYYDNILLLTVEGYNLVQEFYHYTGIDCFKTPREAAAFVLACNSLGILDDMEI